MKILAQLIQLQVILRTLAIYALAVVIVAGTHFTAILQDVLAGSLLADAAFMILLLAILEQSGLLLAISYFLGLLSTLSLLRRRNEMDIIFNLGVSERRLFLWLMGPTILLLFVVGTLVFYITPLSAAQLNHLYGVQIVHKIKGVSAGVNEFWANTAVRVEDHSIQLLRVEDDLIEAVEGDISSNPQIGPTHIVVRLERGFLLRQTEEDSMQTSFEQGQFHIPYRLGTVSSIAAASTLSLWNGRPAERRELYQRIAVFLSISFCLPLALVATRQRTRSSPVFRSFFGICVYFLYLMSVVASIGIVRSNDNSVPFWLIQLFFFASFFTSLFFHFSLLAAWKKYVRPLG